MYRAKQNQEAFLEGGHAWQGSMQKHVTFVTRMGGGWGGRVPDLVLKVACCLQSIWSRIAALPEIASLPCYFNQFSCFLVPGNIWASCVWAPGFSMGWYRADFSIRARLNKGLMTQAQFNRALMLKPARYHPMEKPGAQTQLA